MVGHQPYKSAAPSTDGSSSVRSPRINLRQRWPRDRKRSRNHHYPQNVPWTAFSPDCKTTIAAATSMTCSANHPDLPDQAVSRPQPEDLLYKVHRSQADAASCASNTATSTFSEVIVICLKTSSKTISVLNAPTTSSTPAPSAYIRLHAAACRLRPKYRWSHTNTAVGPHSFRSIPLP